MHEYSVSIDTAGGDDAGDGTRFTLHAEAGRVAAQMMLRRRVGLQAPRHWYHLGRSVHAAAELGVFAHHQTLLLGSDLTGATELHGLRLDDVADAPALPLLLNAAVEWLTKELADDESADPRVFCELPGVRDAQGQSPFWQHLGQHFAPFTPHQAERRFGPQWQRDLAPLLPRHPLLVSLLAEPAQRALSACSEAAQPLATALRAAGFHAGERVGIFDGGPVYEIHLPRDQRAR